jgi:multiple antibiotic resistance protein
MLDLIKAISLGLVVLLPLANPLTTVALFLGLAGNMNSAERNHQSMMASVYVFAIMMVAYYAGQLVMNTFGISIPGLRIAGGLIVAFIGFRMLFPAQKAHESPEAKANRKSWKRSVRQYCLRPLGDAKHRRAGTIAMIISSASTVRDGAFPDWVITVAPPMIFALIGIIVWARCAVLARLCVGWARAVSKLFPV